MHSRLYELRPDIGAIVHTHPAAATAFAVCGKGFPENWVLEVPSLIGKIGIAGYAPAGSRQLVEEVEKNGGQRRHFSAEPWSYHVWAGYFTTPLAGWMRWKIRRRPYLYAQFFRGCEGIFRLSAGLPAVLLRYPEMLLNLLHLFVPDIFPCMDAMHLYQAGQILAARLCVLHLIQWHICLH